MRSDKPAAHKFQDWVTREVLPAIRKDGMYVMGEELLRTGEMSEAASPAQSHVASRISRGTHGDALSVAWGTVVVEAGDAP